LVLNPSFESVNTGSLQCSWYTSEGQFTSAISNWDYPNDGSTDIFHTSLATSCYCSPFSTHASSPGTQAPRTGNAMTNLVVYGSGGCTPYREYLQGELSTTLTVGVTYNIRVYVSLADKSNRATNNIGFKFTTAKQNTGSMCVWNTTPDVNYTGTPITNKTGWTLLTYSFTPTVANLRYFTIGNFFTDGATTTTSVSGSNGTIRYFVDDVSVEVACSMPSAAWTNPSSICAAAGNINLNSLITGTAGGSWSGTGVSGNTFNPGSGTQSVTYTVGTAPCQQTQTHTITVLPDVNPTWTNPAPICANAGNINLNNLITGTTGGSWSGTGVSGNTFNPSSGTQTITYTVGTNPCQETQSHTITVIPDVNPSWTNPSPICAAAGNINLNNLITGTTGGSWSGTGVSGNTFNPSSGTQTVTYSVGTGGCIETQTHTITVLPDVNPTWTNPTPICANAGNINLNNLITGTTGGSWSGTGVSGNTFNPSSGTQTITYTVGTNPCQETQTHTITVIPDVDPTWTNPSPICEAAGSINLNNLITGTTGGSWSGTGVSGNTFNPSSGTQTVTYTVGTGGCIETQAHIITVLPDVDPSWTNPSPVCAAAGNINLNNLITGTTGGTWSGTGVSGNTFNSSAGTQTVTYTVGTSPCQETQSHTITVMNPDATWTNPTPLCEGGGTINLNNLITGTTGGTWSGTGVSGNTLDPTGLGGSTITVTYTVGASPCTQTSALNIVINNDDDASFAYSPLTYCITGTNPLPSSITMNGGGFTINNSGVINPATGEINLVGSGVGTYMVYYNTAPLGNPCPGIDSVQIIITNGPTAGFGYSGLQFCQDSIDPILTLDPGASSGVYSGLPSGLSINPTTGAIDLSNSGAGVYVVYNNVPAQGGCAAVTDSTTIEVLQVDSALFSYSNLTYCLNDTGQLATITGTQGGIFTITSPGVINPTTGQVDIGSSGAGTYTIYYNTAPAGNPCPTEDSLQLMIVPQNTISPNPVDTICLGDTLYLTATSSGAGTITWYSDAAGTNVIGTGTPFIDIPSATGTYVYYVNEDGPCPSEMDSIVVVVRGVTAIINATPQTGPAPLNVFFGNGSTTGAGISYWWDFGTGGDTSTISEPSYIYNDEGQYIVVLVVTDGMCIATDTITIDVFGESSILIPNVFTPNGDGDNDIFTVKGVNLKSVNCDIYNRWGQLMYSWDNVKGYWDGRTLSGNIVPDGTYFYIVKAEGVDGTEYFKKGGFSLIR